MKRIKLYVVLLIISVSSLFLIRGINGIFIKITNPVYNKITILQNTSYTVVHETMNMDGTTYSEYSRLNYTDIPIGTVVIPSVLDLEGFDSPPTQTVTLEGFDNTVITYRYTRKQYTLTIDNSNYVTTTTPSGTYYYGEEIHLVADSEDSNGNSFVKWSNNVTNPDYTFTMTDDVTIEPIYDQAYSIIYYPNNGDSIIIDYVVQDQSLGTLPTVTNNDCSSSTGDYQTRGCTYDYKFEGWYLEPEFITEVNEDYVPTGDTNLFAKWNKVYFAQDETLTCSGTNYLDTGVHMFNELNADKDFIVRFTVDENNGYTTASGVDRGSIFVDMSEVGEPYPGVQFYTNNTGVYTMNINTTGKKVKNNNTGYVTGQSVVIKKENGIVYYSYDGGADVQINNFSNFNTYFDNPASFCAGINSQGNRYRFFKGKISDMSVEMIDPQSYTLHFDSNGGSGMMIDQVVKLGKNTTIKSNNFTKENHSFGGWNTAPDGSGTSYPDNYSITSDLGNNGDVITLYAQWIAPADYTVHFDPNGGTGTMDDQTFVVDGSAKPLSPNQFTRTNYVFRGWNTKADGTGTHYDDEEAVNNLSTTDGDVVTLYADWWKVEYSHAGDAVFNGTASTFIDTGVNVFNTNNFNKDFEIRFTFKTVDSDMFNVSPTQPTMFNVKDESNNKYPGFNIRFNNNINTMYSTARWGGSTSNIPTNGISTANAPIDFVYTRKNGVITMHYSYEGFTSQEYTLITQSSWSLNQPFATNVAFGGYFGSNNQPGRFFKGTLSDMIIIMDD
ncbi:MAG: InlB B-repeat-containing protein [Bacilli bacterium]|nr:InlB B-repeat-containing protein [Bacilli bacterium]